MAAASGRPVHLNTLTLMPHAPDGWSRSLEFARDGARRRPRAPPDVREQPPGRALRARLDVPVRRDAELPRHADAALARTRGSACAIPRCATQMRTEIADPTRPLVRVRVAGAPRRDGREARARARGSTSRHRGSPSELGADPLDAFLDLSLAEDLETQFVLAAPPDAASAGPRPRRMIRVAGRDGRQQRRRRAPALVLRRRLHDPPAHRVGARRARRSRRRSPGSPSIPAARLRHHRPRRARRGHGGRPPADRPRPPRAPATRRATCATSPPTPAATSSTPTGYRAVIVNGEVLLDDGDVDRRDAGPGAPRLPSPLRPTRSARRGRSSASRPRSRGRSRRAHGAPTWSRRGGSGRPRVRSRRRRRTPRRTRS